MELIGLREDLGFMLTPMMGNAPDLSRIMWAADTGCFAAPERFRVTDYLVWLHARRRYASRCFFATAPDVVGDAGATLAKAQPILPLIRELGYRAALVAQDGLESLAVPWDTFDALFIGGTTAWKLSEPTYMLVAEAARRGKWTHQGRVNSLRRLRAAAVSGFDSADGTYVAFGPDVNVPKMLRWLDDLQRQTRLDWTTSAYRTGGVRETREARHGRAALDKLEEVAS